MAASRLIADLSDLLEQRLGNGVSAVVSEWVSERVPEVGTSNDFGRDLSIFSISAPGELDESSAPAVGLYLWEVLPHTDHRVSGHSVEFAVPPGAPGRRSAGVSPDRLRRAPVWLSCRYCVLFRTNRCQEEQQLVAAVLQTLSERPTVGRQELPSLSSDDFLESHGDRFAIRLSTREDLWRVLGLEAPRLLVSFTVCIPLPLSPGRPLGRIFERDVRLEEISEAPQ